MASSCNSQCDNRESIADSLQGLPTADSRICYFRSLGHVKEQSCWSKIPLDQKGDRLNGAILYSVCNACECSIFAQ